MEKIILASASPRRKELLSQINVPFDIIPSEVEEKIDELAGSPGEKAERLALLKAMDVAEKVKEGLVLGADTIVVLDDTIFGKPKDDNDALKMLKGLNGREHLVITGIALVNACNGQVKSGYEVTRVLFDTLADSELIAYINSGEPEGKAGAYAIQGMGALLVKELKGCYFNVVGLPIVLLKSLLRDFRISIL